MIFLNLQKFFFIFFVINSTLSSFTIEKNPGCYDDSCGSSPYSLIYIKSISSNESFHYIWSFTPTFDYPTLLLIKSENKSAKIDISWNKYINSSIKNSELFEAVSIPDVKLSDLAVIVFDGLYVYDDVSNTGQVNNPSNILLETFLLKDQFWNISLAHDNKSVIFIASNLKGNSSKVYNGNIIIDFKPHSQTERQTENPKILFTNTSSEIIFTFSDINIDGNNVRLALQTHLIQSIQYKPLNNPKNNQTINFNSEKSIDDEFSPKTFTTDKIKWKIAGNQTKNSHFWKWNTVAYTKKNDKTQSLTDAKASDIHLFSSYNYENNRLLSAFTNSNLISKSMTVLFGKSNDGFYSTTRYLSWSSMIGFGEPPVDGFSVLSICIFFIVMGFPVVVFLFTGFYFIIKRFRNETVDINDLDSRPLLT